jgi:pyruvate carboxylase
VKQIHETYGEDVRVVFVQNPLSFHARAMPASKAAYAAHLQGKFWEYQAVLFENNKALEDADLEKYAQDLKLDMEKWKKDRDSKQVEDWLKGHQALAAALDASGTPAFFINGEFLSGAQEFDKFKEIIDKQIAKADRLVQKGVPQEALHTVLAGNALSGKYRRFVIEGKTPPQPEQAEAEAAKEPFSKVVAELPVSDSPREGDGDEVVITECSDFQ